MKQTTTLLHLLFAAALLYGCSACKSVKAFLNEHSISGADEQKAAIQANSYYLSQFKTCDFAVNIGVGDLDTLVVPSFGKLINGRKIAHVKEYNIHKLSVTTNDEQINFSADCQLSMDTLDASIEGQLLGTISFSVRNDSLILFPAFRHIHVTDVSYKSIRGLEKKVVALGINTVLDIFIGKLNGYMDANISAIPLNLMDKQIASQELVKDPATQVTLSHPLIISTPLALTSCLINKDGIHLLGCFDWVPAGGNPHGDAVFASFQKAFLAARTSFFAGLPEDKNTYVVLAKRSVATLFNTGLQNETIHVNYTKDNFFAAKADKNIKINLDDIHCGDVSFNCPQLQVVRNCDCPINWNCHGPFAAACRIGEAAARATWYSSVYPPCQAARAAQLAANLSIQAQCATAKVGAIAACEAFKKSLSVVLTNQVSIGDIHTTVSVSGTAVGDVTGLGLAGDLSGISLSLTATVNAPLETTFGFTPEGPAGHLVCALQFDHPYNCTASATKALQAQTFTTSFDNSTPGVLQLTFKTAPIDFAININPSPLALMNRDIPTLINCPLLRFGVGLADLGKGVSDIFSDGNFGDNTVNAICSGKYSYHMDEKTFNLPIHAVYLHNNDSKISLTPIAESSYIGFYTAMVH